MPHPETIKDLGAAARSLISKGTEDVSPETVAALVEGSDEFLREVAEDNAPEQMHAFRKEFAELLKDAEIDRLIVIVGDLDRCLPDTAIETREASRLFLFRSEESREGKECVSTCRYRWSPYPLKTKKI